MQLIEIIKRCGILAYLNSEDMYTSTLFTKNEQTFGNVTRLTELSMGKTNGIACRRQTTPLIICLTSNNSLRCIFSILPYFVINAYNFIYTDSLSASPINVEKFS